jgi:hypothetical protein
MLDLAHAENDDQEWEGGQLICGLLWLFILKCPASVPGDKKGLDISI